MLTNTLRGKIFCRVSAAMAGLALAAGLGIVSATMASAAPVAPVAHVIGAKPANVVFYFPTENYRSGLCIDIASNGVARQEPCNETHHNQDWGFPSGNKAWGRMESLTSHCMGISGNSKASGAWAVLTTCTNTASRQWKPVYIKTVFASPMSEIVNRNSGLCLTVNANSMAKGAVINQARCTKANDQLWFWLSIAG